MERLLRPVIFPRPVPATYTFDSAYPPLAMVTTRLGSSIPVCLAKDRSLHRVKPLSILFSHGNAEDLGSLFLWLRDVGFEIDCSIASFDYTGYGISTNPSGSLPSEQHVYADAEAALDYLIEQTQPHYIILWGRSLGSAPTVYLAKRLKEQGRPAAGVILQSPLASVLRVGMSSAMWSWLVSDPARDIFPNLYRLRESRGFDCPVFVLHGQSDMIVPCSHGEELYESVPPEHQFPPLFVEGAGHNDLDEVLVKQGSSVVFHCVRFVAFCVRGG